MDSPGAEHSEVGSARVEAPCFRFRGCGCERSRVTTRSDSWIAAASAFVFIRDAYSCRCWATRLKTGSRCWPASRRVVMEQPRTAQRE